MKSHRVAAVVSVAVGVALWLLTVVRLPDDATNSPAFWWLMLGAALLLGGLFGPSGEDPVALGLWLPPLFLAPWTAPRGDNDGLWIQWIVVLAAFVLLLALAARLGAMARTRLSGSAGRSAVVDGDSLR